MLGDDDDYYFSTSSDSNNCCCEVNAPSVNGVSQTKLSHLISNLPIKVNIKVKSKSSTAQTSD
jgi:hypothetical protein